MRASCYGVMCVVLRRDNVNKVTMLSTIGAKACRGLRYICASEQLWNKWPGMSSPQVYTALPR